MDNKVPLLLWSGGLDSTFLLLCLLQDSDVDVVSLDGGQARMKCVAESAAREKILAYLRKDFKHRVRVIESVAKVNIANCKNLTWSQPVPWLVGALGAIDASRHSSIQMAYIGGDQAVTQVAQLEQTWAGLQALSLKQAVPIKLPFIHWSKCDILKAIPFDLYELTWTCENPSTEDEQCGHCRPCIDHKTELYRLALQERKIGDGANWSRINLTPTHTPCHNSCDIGPTT